MTVRARWLGTDEVHVPLLDGRLVAPDEVVDFDGFELADRTADAVIMTDAAENEHALARSLWAVEGEPSETRADVLARVGEDPALAHAELEVEKRGRNRKTLLAALQRIADAPEPPADQTATSTDQGD